MEICITLTAEQKTALGQGRVVHVVEPETKMDCVLIRADVFERVESIVLNDGPLSEDERLAAIRFAGERAGWNDPELDVYEEYRTK
jgi:hypothetical protein